MRRSLNHARRAGTGFDAPSSAAATNQRPPVTYKRAAIALFCLLALSVGISAHAAKERFQFGEENVPGWALMSSAERVEHHQKLLGFKRLVDCRTYMEEHRRKMEERARERNRIPRVPRFDVCEQLKSRGLLE